MASFAHLLIRVLIAIVISFGFYTAFWKAINGGPGSPEPGGLQKEVHKSFNQLIPSESEQTNP